MTGRISLGVLALTAGGLAAIAAWEGYRSHAYHDSAGVATIGYGSTRHADGTPVRTGDRITPDRALVRLAADAGHIERQIKACLPASLMLYAHEWDAFVSLAYNIGPGAFCGSTLARLLRKDPPDYAGACEQIKRWTRAGGRELPGLVKRRQAEYRMCLTGER